MDSAMSSDDEEKFQPYPVPMKEELDTVKKEPIIDYSLIKTENTSESSNEENSFDRSLIKIEDTSESDEDDILPHSFVKTENTDSDNDIKVFDHSFIKEEEEEHSDNDNLATFDESERDFDTLPLKSKEVYLSTYNQFMDWRQTKNIDSFTEEVILDYFSDLKATKKSPTLWRNYWLLRTTLNFKHNVDISKYPKLRTFLKSLSLDYEKKITKTFTADNVNKFIYDAPDHIYLGTKVALIMGIMGTCGKKDFYQMKIQDLKDMGKMFIITVPDSKLNSHRKFCITANFYDIVKKFISLRPANYKRDNLFLNYQKGRCMRQVIGINKFGVMPRQIATFLKLPDPKLYTGHCIKRTSRNLMVEECGNLIIVKDVKSDRSHAGCSRLSQETTLANSVAKEISVANNKVSNGEPFEHITTKTEKTSENTEKTLPNPLTIKEVNRNSFELLPPKSKEIYLQLYQHFMDWKKSKNLNSISEEVVFSYILELSSTRKMSTLWKTISVLRTTLSYKDNVDISKYTKLKSLVKALSQNYQSKKTKIFTAEQVNEFLRDAPDDTHLVTKVALVLGLVGYCGRKEFYHMKMQDIEDLQTMYAINVPDSKINTRRRFFLTGNYYDILKKYIDLRPKTCDKENLFLSYQKGRCINQTIGLNKFGVMPSEIAKYLNLPDAKLYTGHCFKCTSRILVFDERSNTFMLRSNKSLDNKFCDDKNISDGSSKIEEVNRDNDEQNMFLGSPSTTKEMEEDCFSSLPAKSKELYLITYQQFIDWRKNNNFDDSLEEDVVLAYFSELKATKKWSTLWRTFSILRTTIYCKNNVDISKYVKLKNLLKKESTVYEAKKTKTLTADEINKFINEAPDIVHLGTKVALILGIMGSCGKKELYQMKIQDIQDLGNTFAINIPFKRTNAQRTFYVAANFYEIVKKFISLRPRDCERDNLFLNYQKGRCTRQVMGINKFGFMPQQVATFLQLTNPKLYTGHCFKRTSQTLLVKECDGIIVLKDRKKRKRNRKKMEEN